MSDCHQVYHICVHVAMFPSCLSLLPLPQHSHPAAVQYRSRVLLFCLCYGVPVIPHLPASYGVVPGGSHDVASWHWDWMLSYWYCPLVAAVEHNSTPSFIGLHMAIPPSVNTTRTRGSLHWLWQGQIHLSTCMEDHSPLRSSVTSVARCNCSKVHQNKAKNL